MWMLQLQRVGVSRLRPREPEGERDDRLSVCPHGAVDGAAHTLPPLSVYSRVFERAPTTRTDGGATKTLR